MLWGANPLAVATLPLVVLLYLSDQANAMFEQAGWRPQVGLMLLLLAVATIAVQAAALEWLRGKGSGAWGALVRTLAGRADLAMLCFIAVLGVLQAAAVVSPFGDDIGHYTDVADAILSGRSYPIHIVNQQLQASGMGAAYPALPVFPLLLALSFSLFGHTTVGVAIPSIVASALFPFALYAAFRSITGSRPVSYAAAVLIFLFPIYRLHAVGTPEPDTVFVDLLLASAALAGKAARGSSSIWARVQSRHSRESGNPAGHVDSRLRGNDGAEGGIRPPETKLSRIWWLAMGVVMGLATLTRPEGVPYAAVIFGVFFLGRWRQTGYWLSVAGFVATLVPFMAVYFSVAGAPWPSTFGGSLLSVRNLWTNLAALQWPALGWYAQAIGVSSDALQSLVLLVCLITALGTLALWKSSGVLVAIPIAGAANLAMAFFVSPTVLGSYSPVDALRHLSYGMPYAAVGTAYAGAVAVRFLARNARWPRLVLIACVLLSTAYLYDEAERLALPEPYFGGPATLLWTDSGVLLTDLVAHPVEFPWAGDPRPWETVRVELGAPLEPVSLNRVNRSEPYHWSSLLAALLGLVCAAAPAAAKMAGAELTRIQPSISSRYPA